ncbi:MAG: hypothetical protein IPM38_14525 [Ignavibacteria bacterium]|nr:hypothetical protein [Ignavibacteria bacterium]
MHGIRGFSRGVKSKLSERIAKDFGFKENQIIISYGSEDILKQLIHRYLSRGGKFLFRKKRGGIIKKSLMKSADLM